MGLAMKMESPHPLWPENQRPTTPPSHQPAPHLPSHQSLVSKTKPFPPKDRKGPETLNYTGDGFFFVSFCPLLLHVSFCFLIILVFSSPSSPHSLVHSPCLASPASSARVLAQSDSLTTLRSAALASASPSPSISCVSIVSSPFRSRA